MLALAFVLIISTLIMDHSTIYLYQLLRDKLSVMAPPAVRLTGTAGSSITNRTFLPLLNLYRGTIIYRAVGLCICANHITILYV